MNRRKFVEDLLATYPHPDDLEWSTETVKELLAEIVRLEGEVKTWKERTRLCSETLIRVEEELVRKTEQARLCSEELGRVEAENVRLDGENKRLREGKMKVLPFSEDPIDMG